MTFVRDQQKSTQEAQAVEDRVAELESILRREGIGGYGQKRKQQLDRDGHADSTALVDAPVARTWRPSPTSERQSDNPTPTPKRMAVSTVVEILRDLSIEASGGYIGASSQITMGRMISSIVQAREYTVGGTGERTAWEHLSPKSANTASSPSESGLEFAQVPPEIADRLFAGYIRHISTTWPVLQTPFMRLLHTERHTLSDAFFTSVLHLIYAIAGRFLETTGETGDFFPEQHYDQALKNMDDILRLHDIRSVQFLLLLSIYSLRSPRGPGAWTYTGLAMRQCIDMGLHRKTQKKKRSLLEHEMRKRVFWTCYCLDRQVSIILGRPFAISDRDIDVELPLDVDEACESTTVLEEAQEASTQKPDGPVTKSTSMTGFIHICRLRIIESNIQQSIYRVDQSTTATEAEAERFIQRLEEWKANMPTDASSIDTKTMVIDGVDNYMVYYYKCLRFLLHPVILSSELSDSKFLRKCAEACGGVCRTYKKLHQKVPVGFSVMALHSVFLAGLTLIYCAWASPKEVFSISTSNDMNACSIVLYIITERWPGARKYRDVYETIKQMVLESIEEGDYEPRRVITNLRPGLQAALHAIECDDEGQGEFSAMVADMAGAAAAQPTAETPPAQAVNSTANTPGSHGGFNFMLPLDGMPLDFHEVDAFNAMDMQMGTIFATPTSNEWMMN